MPSPSVAPPDPVTRVLMELMGPGGKYAIQPVKNETDEFIAFKDLPKNFPSLIKTSLERYSDLDCLVYEGERSTYAEVQRDIEALAAALVTSFGVKKGDRVAVAMRNYPEWCVSFLAITSIGCVVVPLNGWWRENELEYGLKDSGTKVLICDQTRFERALSSTTVLGIPCVVVRADSQTIPMVHSRSHPGAVVQHYHDFLATGRALCQSGKAKDVIWRGISTITHSDLVAIMYTSGTTGHPKGVMLSDLGVLTQLNLALFMVDMQTKLNTREAHPCALCPIPLFHVTACHHNFLSSIVTGNKLVLMYKWDTTRALELIQREKVTKFSAVPTMAHDLANHPRLHEYDTSSLMAVGGGGAPVSSAVVRSVKRKFAKASPNQGYGMTELNGAVASIVGSDFLARPTSTGKPFPFVLAEIINPNNLKVLPRNTPGELVVNTPLMMVAYFNKPEATKKTIISLPERGGRWLRTGDVAKIDDDGYIYILDRIKQLVIRGGENIGTSEVEDAIYTNESVSEVAVFGLPDERLGEVVAAAVLMKPGHGGVTATELVSGLHGKLASFKIPHAKDVFFWPQGTPLPRGATGKIHKGDIKKKVLETIKRGEVRVTIQRQSKL
eukprot:TRINITY_DN2757_c1_g1_i2.p1 TRINITY_DN2757_c1_g1~~TRINITY_DN2757_c1_g1_i2.p1  ORF type:complete len:611 (-),score=85.08 TRINITY_DN2757_c1_g1_i2:353-2185(-)